MRTPPPPPPPGGFFGPPFSREPPHALLESLDDGVHAAHGLEQRRVLVEGVAVVELVAPEFRPEQLAEVQGVVHFPGLHALVDALAPVAAARGPLVETVRLLQVAVTDQHFEDALLVLARELAVEGIAAHRLGEQLGDVAAHVGPDLAPRHGLAAEPLPVVEQGRAVVVGEDLQLDAELLAVAEDRPVVVGDAGRPEVRVHMVLPVEAHPLAAVGLPHHVAAAHGEVAPAGSAGGLQDGAAVTGFRQLVGRGHAGDAGPEDGHALALAGAAGQVEGRRVSLAHPRQAQGMHGPIDGVHPGHSADGLDEVSPGHLHGRHLPFRRPSPRGPVRARRRERIPGRRGSCRAFLQGPCGRVILARTIARTRPQEKRWRGVGRPGSSRCADPDRRCTPPPDPPVDGSDAGPRPFLTFGNGASSFSVFVHPGRCARGVSGSPAG